MGKEATSVVRFTDEERQTLPQLVAGPRVARDKALRARMLLQTDVAGPGGSDGQSAEAFEVGVSTLPRWRQRVGEDGLAAALHRPPLARTTPRTLDGAPAARLVAIAWSQAPAGRTSWTLHLLAAKLGERAIVASLCLEPVRKTLKKTTSRPG